MSFSFSWQSVKPRASGGVQQIAEHSVHRFRIRLNALSLAAVKRKHAQTLAAQTVADVHDAAEQRLVRFKIGR